MVILRIRGRVLCLSSWIGKRIFYEEDDYSNHVSLTRCQAAEAHEMVTDIRSGKNS